MERTILDWAVYCLLFVWQLPQNIVGAAMWLYFKLMGDVEKIEATKWSVAYKSTYMSGGISLGSFCFLSRYMATRKEYVAHELKGHTVDSRIMGPFYLFIIGLPSLLNAMFNFTRCDFDFFTEKLANMHAGLKVDKYCRLSFKNEKTTV